MTWGPGKDYQSTGPITTVAQLHRLAKELLRHVHADSVMASAAKLALRQPDFFMARPTEQEKLIDMVKRYAMAPPRKMKRNAPLKDVRAVGANMTEAHHGLIHILYSYKTPVAIFGPSGLYKTEKHWSNTTSRHITKWFAMWNLDAKGAAKIPQDTLEAYAEMGKDPGTAPEFARSSKKNPPKKRILSVPEQHQLKVARDTLKMNDVMARVMGGPSKAEARAIVKRLTGKSNPARRIRVRAAKRFVTRKHRTNGRAPLRPRRRSTTVKRRRANPLIGVLGNPPPSGKMLGKATYIEYTHAHDGQLYFHHFKPAVYAVLTDDGAVRLFHPTNKLFKMFDVK